MTYDALEQEVILLRAVWDMIDGMVNFVIFDDDYRVTGGDLRFKSSEHQQLFNILLVDFLSKPPAGLFDLPDANGPRATDQTYLFHLRRICNDPNFAGNVDPLRAAVNAFADWLEHDAVIEGVWLPSIDVELNLKVARISSLKISGDSAKHNFSRLDRNVRRVVKLLSLNGVTIDKGQAFLALPDLYEWLHRDFLGFHTNSIAEYLNEIRWGIYEYLRTEFERSYEPIEPKPMYKFKIPPDCADPLAQAMYWDLMNHVRGKPYFPRFTTSRWLKNRY